MIILEERDDAMPVEGIRLRSLETLVVAHHLSSGPVLRSPIQHERRESSLVRRKVNIMNEWQAPSRRHIYNVFIDTYLDDAGIYMVQLSSG